MEKTLTQKTTRRGFYIGVQPLYVKAVNVGGTGYNRVFRMVKGMKAADLCADATESHFFTTKHEALENCYPGFDCNDDECVAKWYKATLPVACRFMDGSVRMIHPLTR